MIKGFFLKTGLILFAAVACLIAYFSVLMIHQNIPSIPLQQKVLDELIEGFAKELRESQGLQLIGSGALLQKEEKSISMHLWSYEEMGVEEARALYVEVVQELLTRVNTSHEIKEYLEGSLFSFEDLDIDLLFFKANGDHVGKEFVSMVHASKKELFYKAYNPVRQSFDLLHSENFEDAKKDHAN